MKFLAYALIAVSALFLSSCKPNPEQLKKTMEDNPDILFAVIKKHPDKFLEVVNEAAREAQVKSRERESQEMEKEREEEFKNPKTVEVQAWRAILGNKNAPITIVEYSDFQCPFCKRGHATVQQIMEVYKEKVRLVFKHLPLDFHPSAMPASQIFEAINIQSGAEKAYQWHDLVFNGQDNLKGPDKGVKWMLDQAKKVGADPAKVKKDMESEDVKKRIEADMAEANKYGFRGTPGYLINGVSLKGAYPAPEFKKVIDRILTGK